MTSMHPRPAAAPIDRPGHAEGGVLTRREALDRRWAHAPANRGRWAVNRSPSCRTMRLGSRTSDLEWKVEDLGNKVETLEVVVSLLTIILVALFAVLCAVVVK